MKFFILSLLVSSSVFAGVREGGNGGVSVVCRNSTGTIVSAELLDLYEAKNDPTLNLRITEYPH